FGGVGLSIWVWREVGLDRPPSAWLGGCVPVAAPAAGQTGDCRSGFDSGTGWLLREVFRLFSARRNERRRPVRLLAGSLSDHQGASGFWDRTRNIFHPLQTNQGAD